MNKKLLELLDAINEKKAIVRDLVDSGKIEEAKAAKAELVELQDKFDLLKDMDDEPGVTMVSFAILQSESLKKYHFPPSSFHPLAAAPVSVR